MRKKQGFTLIEMMIVLSITTIIFGITTSMFIEGNRIFSDSDVKSTLQIEGQAIQEKISNLAMQAVGTDDINGIEVIKLYNENGETIYYEINQDEKELSIIEYSKNDKGELELEDQKYISDNVKSFNVEYSNNSAKFEIELNLKKSFSEVSYPIEFTVNFRNYGIQST